MGLIGHWRRSVLGAGGVALLLPLGLALGVGLTTALGGDTTLRALGQVFAGPSAPVARGKGPSIEAPRSVPAVPVRARPAVVPASGGGGAAVVPSSGGETPASGGGGGTTNEGGATDPGGGTPAGGDTSGGDTGGEPEGSALHETVEGATEAVPALPGPAGAVVDDAMQTVVDLIP